MQVTISIKQDNGSVIEFIQELDTQTLFDEKDIINSIEKQVLSIQSSFLPLLSAKLVEQHQAGFEGEKNKEKEWE
jgi:hypothetical protein